MHYLASDEKSPPPLLLSVITPVYNGGKYIEETVQSVINCSTSVSFEYILVNDGSTDDTLEIISKYSDRIIILSQPNMGEANAVNMGIQSAKGKYCLVLSADDPLLTGKLFDVSVGELQRHPQHVATYVDWNVIDDKGSILRTKQTKNYSRIELIGYFNCLPGPGAIFRTSSARNIRGRSDIFKYVSDYDFWLRLSIEGDFLRIPRVLAQWREHSESTTVSKQNLRMAEERIEVISKFVQSTKLDESLANSALAHAYYYAARLSLTGQGIPARRYLFHAFLQGKKWPKRANVLVVLLIIFNPFPASIFKILERITPKVFRINQ
jgi:glycosyltransferase involved in cell wall biosynthesis